MQYIPFLHDNVKSHPAERYLKVLSQYNYNAWGQGCSGVNRSHNKNNWHCYSVLSIWQYNYVPTAALSMYCSTAHTVFCVEMPKMYHYSQLTISESESDSCSHNPGFLPWKEWYLREQHTSLKRFLIHISTYLLLQWQWLKKHQQG